MDTKKFFNDIKKAWNWIWNSDSIFSWIIALIIIFIIIKFVLFPILSLIMGTSLPLAGVESSSMDHQIAKNEYGRLTLCGNTYDEKERYNFEEYWDICGKWYEDRDITKAQFEEFPIKNGFKKGDIIIVWGRFEPKVGDIIIFQVNPESSSPHPVIHRIVKIENGIIETKGDHNKEQLTKNNNPFNTDETNIRQSQIVGKAIIKVPYLGWPKIWLTEFINIFRN